MRFGSVCSGIEAASVAWEPLGWKAAWFSEIATFPSLVLAHRFPSITNHGSMLGLADRLSGADRSIDLLVGGTPCQSFSVAGLRAGLADERGNLALEFARLAQALRPRWLCWENVPGVLSSERGRDFGAIVGGLVDLGYDCAWRVLDARFFGVPQRRRRVFLVGCLGGGPAAGAVLFERTGLRRNPSPRSKTREDVAGTVGSGTSRRGWNSDTDRMTFVPEVAGTLRGNQQQSDLPSNGRAFVAEVAPTLQTQQRRVDVDNALGLIIGTSAEGGEGFTLTSSNLGKTVNNQTPLLAFDPTQVTHPENRSSCAGDSAALAKSARPPHIAYSCITGDVTHALLSEGADASEDGSGRGTPIVAPTLEATDGEKWGSNQWVDKSVELLNAQAELGWKVRRLTPRECERLQDFPDDWTLVPGASDSTRYAALGNSMAVCVMRWIGRRIGLVDSILFGGAA